MSGRLGGHPKTDGGKIEHALKKIYEEAHSVKEIGEFGRVDWSEAGYNI